MTLTFVSVCGKCQGDVQSAQGSCVITVYYKALLNAVECSIPLNGPS